MACALTSFSCVSASGLRAVGVSRFQSDGDFFAAFFAASAVAATAPVAISAVGTPVSAPFVANNFVRCVLLANAVA